MRIQNLPIYFGMEAISYKGTQLSGVATAGRE